MTWEMVKTVTMDLVYDAKTGLNLRTACREGDPLVWR